MGKHLATKRAPRATRVSRWTLPALAAAIALGMMGTVALADEPTASPTAGSAAEQQANVVVEQADVTSTSSAPATPAAPSSEAPADPSTETTVPSDLTVDPAPAAPSSDLQQDAAPATDDSAAGTDTPVADPEAPAAAAKKAPEAKAEPEPLAAVDPTKMKVFVCKYVGTPGVDETLKNGLNPMSVGNGKNRAPGDWFNDAQGRSYILAWDDGTISPTRDDCPINQPIIEIPIPIEGAVSDPCGPANATWILPVDTDAVAWSLSAGRLIATAKTGYVFPGGARTHDFGLAVDSGVPCPVDPDPVPVPATPDIVDPCGPDNASWLVPDSTPEVYWTLTNDVLVAHASPGLVFVDGRTTISFGVAADSGEPCDEPGTLPVPPTPDILDPCGPANASWVIPADTEEVEWVIDETGFLSAVSATGLNFENGSWVVDFGIATDSNEPCDNPVDPTDPSDPTDPTTPAQPTVPVAPQTQTPVAKPVVKAGGALAQTGVSALEPLLIAGGALVLGAALLLAARRRTQ